ncbi:hypothetical protein DM02DRAFT_287179 [Periconia macrospinosa]|uniref:Uncharacterized protein n=1 Tax=Periconia macrospinosa TaxID=97972 RepID=A0A2V1EDD4_9PLEO|nr:hypothetical protein DM02DRAFT_287179 [Periconia macrospinosa]
MCMDRKRKKEMSMVGPANPLQALTRQTVEGEPRECAANHNAPPSDIGCSLATRYHLFVPFFPSNSPSTTQHHSTTHSTPPPPQPPQCSSSVPRYCHTSSCCCCCCHVDSTQTYQDKNNHPFICTRLPCLVPPPILRQISPVLPSHILPFSLPILVASTHPAVSTQLWFERNPFTNVYIHTQPCDASSPTLNNSPWNHSLGSSILPPPKSKKPFYSKSNTCSNYAHGIPCERLFTHKPSHMVSLLDTIIHHEQI